MEFWERCGFRDVDFYLFIYTYYFPPFRVEVVRHTPRIWPVLKSYAMVDSCASSIINL